MAQNANLRPYFVTTTIKDGSDLSERFKHLVNSERCYKQLRRDALKGRRFVEYAKALGGVSSIEFKRGKNSGLWHPHQHSIWLCEEAPKAQKSQKNGMQLQVIRLLLMFVPCMAI